MITLVDGDRHHDLHANILAGRAWVDPEAFAAATGWQLKPEGLCRGDVCVPVRDPAALLDDNGTRLDLVAVLRALGREVVADLDRGVLAASEQAAAIAETMVSLQAPPFTLPGLDGRPVSLADFDRRKRLLLAWSSW